MEALVWTNHNYLPSDLKTGPDRGYGGEVRMRTYVRLKGDVPELIPMSTAGELYVRSIFPRLLLVFS